ncbi:MAG: DNA-formamidopyrimidine glycosylase family protein [Candidatus Bipolaricaulota bacterium]
MPEWPEIACRTREMNARLVGRRIEEVEVRQPKCLNVSEGTFAVALRGQAFGDISCRGKWILAETTGPTLLLNLGMGGEILLVPSGHPPEAWKVRFRLGPETLSINFWWFGSAHIVDANRLDEHPTVGRLGPDAPAVSVDDLASLLRGRRGAIKPFLLDQTKVAGIGNAYIHDILFRARLHPLRPIATLAPPEIRRLHAAIVGELERSLEKGGAFYEVDLDGRRGGFTALDLQVGYREGSPCPVCGTTIVKIKTGSTSSYICPRCQRMEGASPTNAATSAARA